jgi:hypothetical protein
VRCGCTCASVRSMLHAHHFTLNMLQTLDPKPTIFRLLCFIRFSMEAAPVVVPAQAVDVACFFSPICPVSPVLIPLTLCRWSFRSVAPPQTALPPLGQHSPCGLQATSYLAIQFTNPVRFAVCATFPWSACHMAASCQQKSSRAPATPSGPARAACISSRSVPGCEGAAPVALPAGAARHGRPS